MMKRLLVPLDGSELAERALVVAGALAESLNGSLMIARVVPPPTPGRFYSSHLLKELEEAQLQEGAAYLAAVADRLREDRLTVETRLLHGEVAPTLLDLADRERCDLIVISSHGAGGLGAQVFGSLARKLLYAARHPVLVVPATAAQLEHEEEHEEAATDNALLAELSHAAMR